MKRRHHDDRTGKYNNILGGAVDEKDDQLFGD